MKKLLLILAFQLFSVSAFQLRAQPMPVIYAATNFTATALTNGVTIQPWPASGSVMIYSNTYTAGLPYHFHPSTNGIFHFNLFPNVYRLLIDGLTRGILFVVTNGYTGGTNEVFLADLPQDGTGMFTWTNNFNALTRATDGDTTPATLTHKLLVAGTLVKIENGSTITLSNPPSPIIVSNLSGTIGYSNLPANVVYANSNQTFSGAQLLTNANNVLAGDGAAIGNLTGANLTGPLTNSTTGNAATAALATNALNAALASNVVPNLNLTNLIVSGDSNRLGGNLFFPKSTVTTLVDGPNYAINLGTNPVVFLDGSPTPTAAELHGFAAGHEGLMKIIRVPYGTALKNEGGDPTPANRIYTLTGADVTGGNNYFFVTLLYTSSRWLIVNSFGLPLVATTTNAPTLPDYYAFTNYAGTNFLAVTADLNAGQITNAPWLTNGQSGVVFPELAVTNALLVNDNNRALKDSSGYFTVDFQHGYLMGGEHEGATVLWRAHQLAVHSNGSVTMLDWADTNTLRVSAPALSVATNGTWGIDTNYLVVAGDTQFGTDGSYKFISPGFGRVPDGDGGFVASISPLGGIFNLNAELVFTNHPEEAIPGTYTSTDGNDYTVQVTWGTSLSNASVTTAALTVAGTNTAAYFVGDGGGLTNVPFGGYSPGIISPALAIDASSPPGQLMVWDGVNDLRSILDLSPGEVRLSGYGYSTGSLEIRSVLEMNNGRVAWNWFGPTPADPSQLQGQTYLTSAIGDGLLQLNLIFWNVDRTSIVSYPAITVASNGVTEISSASADMGSFAGLRLANGYVEFPRGGNGAGLTNLTFAGIEGLAAVTPDTTLWITNNGRVFKVLAEEAP